MNLNNFLYLENIQDKIVDKVENKSLLQSNF